MQSDQKKTKYQWNADDYATHSNAQKKWADELILKLNLKGYESLLDIGCGDGKITASIATHLKHGKVMGIDSSATMIALAQERFSAHDFTNLSFRQEDARTLPFDDQFDIVFSNAALHWVIDHRPVLKGIYRALKPGGKVVIQMGGKGNAAQVIDVVDELLQTSRWKPYFQQFAFPYGFYSPEEYQPWLEDAGFSIADLKLIPKDMIHENIEAFKGWIRTTWLPYIQRIPSNLQMAFIDTIADNYLQSTRLGPTEKIHPQMQRLEFIVKKTRLK